MKNKILKYSLFVSGGSLIFIALLLFMLNDLTRNTLLNPNKEVPLSLLNNISIQYHILKDEKSKRENPLLDKNIQLENLSTDEITSFIEIIEEMLKDKKISFKEYNLFLDTVEKNKKLILQRGYVSNE